MLTIMKGIKIVQNNEGGAHSEQEESVNPDHSNTNADVLALRGPIEAILMVVDRPVTAEEIAEALDMESGVIHQVLGVLSEEYRGMHGEPIRGFELRNVGGGWRFYSAAPWADIVGRFILGSSHARLSQAALETLAVIAYRQPVTRSRISHIRGVNVDAVVRTLVTRGLVEEVGESSSGARLYGTTTTFLERMGFDSLDDLVPLAPYLPGREELDDLEETL